MLRHSCYSSVKTAFPILSSFSTRNAGRSISSTLFAAAFSSSPVNYGNHGTPYSEPLKDGIQFAWWRSDGWVSVAICPRTWSRERRVRWRLLQPFRNLRHGRRVPHSYCPLFLSSSNVRQTLIILSGNPSPQRTRMLSSIQFVVAEFPGGV